jgi:hypothetical protein
MIENTFQYNHTTKIEIEKNISKYWQHMETSANAVTGRGRFGCAGAEQLL